MRKKSLLIFMCILYILSITVIEVHAGMPKTSADFTDLKDMDVKTKLKVDKWLSAGLIQGVSENRFGLNETITRAEFAKIVALSIGVEIDPEVKTSSFNDVKTEDLIYGYSLPFIEALRQAGVIDGTDIDRFNPGGEVTKEQFAVFLVRSLGKEAEAKQTQDVTDQTVSTYAKGYVALALQLFPYLRSEGAYNGLIPITRQMVLLGLDDLTVRY
ncbi:S-layer homology domain-containing protein [Paenibacillus alba]|uniref:S-layer homology domain-containing protein n=1 Tax=Paenibacillus alba TaxID=1197127 RepID=A0ABU6G763_9BACL|nr:S-layer homology domain-containing protein [Paenibacillus alba]MEC0229991.1 S-layer homology domain-containing protein [Paenibacillus alba]